MISGECAVCGLMLFDELLELHDGDIVAVRDRAAYEQFTDRRTGKNVWRERKIPKDPAMNRLMHHPGQGTRPHEFEHVCGEDKIARQDARRSKRKTLIRVLPADLARAYREARETNARRLLFHPSGSIYPA
jgi:hypothetical protein